MSSWPESEWRVESLTEDRATVVASHASEGPDDMSTQERLVFRLVGNYIYEFDYVYFAAPNPYLDGVFAASAETAIIKSP
jgi:hypothetical protein